MDWLNPDSWKGPAEPIGDWRTIIGAGVAIVTALGAATKKVRAIAHQLWVTVLNRSPTHLRVDLRFVTDDIGTFWTGVGPLGSERSAHLRGRWHVTNVSDQHVFLLKFRIRGLATEHHALFATETDAHHHSLIPAGSLLALTADCVSKQPLEANQPVVTDVIFTDNFGDEHTSKSVRFGYRGP
jgi:hypothetical protein